MKAKKSLGQNFLKSQKALASIIDAGDVTVNDIILEIGPGKGALTEKLLMFTGKVIAVEKDSELVEFLKEKFKDEIAKNKLEILEEDILHMDEMFLKFSSRPNTKENSKSSYKIIANIPYYITGMILRKFLESNYQPERMVLLVQKEVAERIVARDKKGSILSMSVKIYGEPKYVETVKKRYFSPEPKVDSAILLIDEISKEKFAENNITEEQFFSVLKNGFAHKRKVLSSNLKPLFGKETANILLECKIPEKARAETLSLEHWICLTKKL